MYLNTQVLGKVEESKLQHWSSFLYTLTVTWTWTQLVCFQTPQAGKWDNANTEGKQENLTIKDLVIHKSDMTVLWFAYRDCQHSRKTGEPHYKRPGHTVISTHCCFLVCLGPYSLQWCIGRAWLSESANDCVLRWAAIMPVSAVLLVVAGRVKRPPP